MSVYRTIGPLVMQEGSEVWFPWQHTWGSHRVKPDAITDYGGIKLPFNVFTNHYLVQIMLILMRAIIVLTGNYGLLVSSNFRNYILLLKPRWPVHDQKLLITNDIDKPMC